MLWQDLYLHSNKIGDAGTSALADACASGALANVRELGLHANKIGDAGMSALAGACARGALASLKTLHVDDGALGTEHPQLMEVCSSRGIELP